jgi:hypothetical protein
MKSMVDTLEVTSVVMLRLELELQDRRNHEKHLVLVELALLVAVRAM